MDKKRATSIIIQAANLYHNNLEDKKVLFTKGDRNEIQDACPVKEGQIQGIVKGCIPVVGYGILFFKAKYRMVILIVLLGTAEGICLLMERKEEQKHKC